MYGAPPAGVFVGLLVLLAGGGVATVVVAINAPSTDTVATQQAERDLKAQNYDIGTTKVTIKDGVQEGTTYLKGLRRTFTIAFVAGKWQPVCRSLDGVDVPLSNATLNKDVNGSAKKKCPVGFNSGIYIPR